VLSALGPQKAEELKHDLDLSGPETTS
jgi:hypothetical protein